MHRWAPSVFCRYPSIFQTASRSCTSVSCRFYGTEFVSPFPVKKPLSLGAGNMRRMDFLLKYLQQVPDLRQYLHLNVTPQVVSSTMVSSSILMFNREVSYKSASSTRKVCLLHVLLRETSRQGRNVNNFNCKVLIFKRLLHYLFLFFLVKPNQPENVTFFWKEDSVTVSCNKPRRAVKCLRLELQYKSKYDKDWQVSWT